MIKKTLIQTSNNSHKKLYKLLTKILIFIIFLNILIIFTPSDADAQTLTVVRAEINSEVRPAEVGLAQSGAVRYFGNVTVNRAKSTLQALIVFLYADAGGEGWGSSITQMVHVPAATARITQRIPFTMTIVAPPRASITETREVHITGHWQTFTGSDAVSGEVEGTAIVQTVKQFRLFTVIPINDLARTWPAEKAEFELSIKNMGNGPDTFYITITDYENLSNLGYTVELDTNTLDIEEGGEESFKIKVRGSQGQFYIWKSHQTPIPISIESETSSIGYEQPVIRQWVLIYYEVGFFFPDHCIILIILAVVIVATLVWARRTNRLFWKIKSYNNYRKKEKRSSDDD